MVSPGLYCCSPVSKSCPTLCNPMDCITPGFSVLHCLPEFAQIESTWVGGHGEWFGKLSNHLILYHPFLLLSSIFPDIKVFFQWVDSLHQVTKVLGLQLQHQSFQWIFRVDFLQDWLVWSPCCPRDSQQSSLALQFESINSSVLCLLYGTTLTQLLENL